VTPLLSPTTTDLSQQQSAAQRVADVAAAGLQVAAQSGEAVVAGCDLLGMLFEGLFGLLAGLLR
jgi:hypothetical protein